MNSVIDSGTGTPTQMGTPREIILQPDALEVPIEELLMTPGRIIGEPSPDECVFIPGPLISSMDDPPKPATTRPGGRKRRPPAEPFHTTLFEEMQPLIECVNILGGSGSRMLWSEVRPPARRPIPRGATASITECAVTLDLHLLETENPPSFRHQILWTLVRVANWGTPAIAGGRPASATERQRGSLRLPLRFELEQRNDGHGFNTPIWRQRLHITCAEADRVQAIRRQVDLLCEHLAERGNLLPLTHPSMLV